MWRINLEIHDDSGTTEDKIVRLEEKYDITPWATGEGGKERQYQFSSQKEAFEFFNKAKKLRNVTADIDQDKRNRS